MAGRQTRKKNGEIKYRLKTEQRIKKPMKTKEKK
jgi:hypothetical protein